MATPQAPRPTVTGAASVPSASAYGEAVPSSKFVSIARPNGTRHASASAALVGVQTPVRQLSSPVQTSREPQGASSGAAAHALVQQSPSISLPSSQASLAWFTTPSPQRGGGTVVLVELEVDVLELDEVDDVDEVDELLVVEVVVGNVPRSSTSMPAASISRPITWPTASTPGPRSTSE